MKHLDFTAIQILDIEGGLSTLTRTDAPHQCELCGEPAEYVLRSDWDEIGQCIVAECQACLIEQSSLNPMVDAYLLDGVQIRTS